MIKFYCAPWSRASGLLWLLEELGVDYERELVDIRAEGGVPEDYRRIQPNKKVPAIDHDGVIVTERAAITIYLADAFPDAQLAPAIGSRERGPYLTANVYSDSVLDPCVTAKAHGLSYKSNDYSFGLFDDMVAYLERCLGEHPYAAGDAFTAADTQLGMAVGYTMDNIKILPERPLFREYMTRLETRPAYTRSRQIDTAEAMKVPFFQKMFAEKASDKP